MKPAHRGMLLMVAFAALWAAVELIAPFLQRPYFAYQVVWTRYAVQLTFMLALFGWRDPASLIRTRRPVFQLARSLLMLVMPASWIMATHRGEAAGTLMGLFWLSPLFIVGLACALLRERPGYGLWIAAATASAGAMLLMRPHFDLSLPELALPLIMAGSFSLYVVMTRSLRTESTRANLFYTALGVFLCLSPLMPRVWITPTAHDLVILIAIGLFGCAFLYMLDCAAAAAPVSDWAPLTALQPVIILAITAVSAHERPMPGSWVAVALVAAAAVLALLPDSRAERRYAI